VSTAEKNFIPQTDPRASYIAQKDEIDEAIARVLDKGRYILGPEVTAFENEFAAAIGAEHGVGVANGTDALLLAIRALGIGPGDVIFTVSQTAVATVAAIELAGATPVLVDIDADSFTMDPGALKDAIERQTAGKPRAVVPVHLYGHPADMNAISAIAAEHDLRVIEDCAQSHLASVDGRMTGTIGDVATFSFYPTKNLGAIGDGGMVVTRDAAIADRVRLLRQYGWRDRYVSEESGLNSRLDELQAAILRVKLAKLASGNDRRRSIAAGYRAGISSRQTSLPSERSGIQHSYHQFVIRHPRRDELKSYLEQHGIGTLIHYPVPVHLQPAYSSRRLAFSQLTETEKAVAEILSLPMYPELSGSAVNRVCEHVNRFDSV
jgi:dTDP-4-amino-4,6-dideoxygalactose transaminase